MSYDFYKNAGKNSIDDYISILFNKSERISLGSTVYSCQTIESNDYKKINNPRYICINSGSGRKASDIQLFRNFLVEIDEIELLDQLAHIKNIEMPFSTLVFSGNKSFHYIISLEEPLRDLEQYKFVASWIQNIVKVCDPQALMCSKLTRFPNAVREDTERIQKLIKVNKRVSSKDFIDWLEKFNDCIPKPKTILPPSGEFFKQFTDRTPVIRTMLWYVNEYLSEDYNGHRKMVQCPVCALDGRDRHKDNMCISGEDMKFTCFANSEHNKTIYKTLLMLKRKEISHE